MTVEKPYSILLLGEGGEGPSYRVLSDGSIEIEHDIGGGWEPYSAPIWVWMMACAYADLSKEAEEAGGRLEAAKTGEVKKELRTMSDRDLPWEAMEAALAMRRAIGWGDREGYKKHLLRHHALTAEILRREEEP